MNYSFFQRNGHYFYKIFFVITFSIVVLLLVKNALPFASQNAYYHSVFGTNLFNKYFTTSEILQNSQFHKGYVDQHIGFHFLVWLANLIYSPEIAIKMLTCVFLGLTMFQLIRSENFVDALFVTSLFLFLIFFQFYSFQRLFWERPQFLNLFVLVYYLYSLGKEKYVGVLFLVSLAFSLVSFETGVWILGMGFIDYFFGSKNKKYLISCLGAVLLSLFIFPFGLSKLNYIVSLLNHNLFYEKYISEWAPGKEWNYQHLILTSFLFLSLFLPVRWQSARLKVYQLCSLTFLLLSVKIVRFEYLYIFFIFLCFVEFLTKILNTKLKYVFSIFFLLGFAFYFPRAQSSFKGDTQNGYKVGKFLDWYQQSNYKDQRFINYKWEYWSTLFYYDNFTKSEPGFSMFIYQKNEDLVKAYNYIRYQLDDVDITYLTHFFSSFKSRFLLIDNNAKLLKVYREKKWPLVPLYTDEYFTFLEFRDPRVSFNGYYQNKPLAETCLLSDHCPESFIKRINNQNQIDVFVLVPEEDNTFPMIPFSLGHFAYADRTTKSIVGSEDFFFKPKVLNKDEKVNFYYEYSFYKMNQKWNLAEKNFIFTDSNTFLKNIDDLFLNYLKKKSNDLFYKLGERENLVQNSRIRKLMGMLYLCMNSRTHKNCMNLILGYDFSNVANWDLGSKSILGLVQEHLDNLEIAKINNKHDKLYLKLPSMILSHYNDAFEFWQSEKENPKEIFTDANYVFAVGEALTYLSYKQKDLSVPWLEKEIDKYYNHFVKTQGVYSIRWLLSMLSYQYQQVRDLTPKSVLENKIKKIFEIISSRFLYPFDSPHFSKGCYYNKSFEEKSSSYFFDHHSGLILEGLSYFANIKFIAEDKVYKRLIQGYAQCTLKQQIRTENYYKLRALKSEVGGVRTQPGLNEIRVDVLAHLGIGLYKISLNDELNNLINFEN